MVVKVFVKLFSTELQYIQTFWHILEGFCLWNVQRWFRKKILDLIWFCPDHGGHVGPQWDPIGVSAWHRSRFSPCRTTEAEHLSRIEPPPPHVPARRGGLPASTLCLCSDWMPPRIPSLPLSAFWLTGWGSKDWWEVCLCHQWETRVNRLCFSFATDQLKAMMDVKTPDTTLINDHWCSNSAPSPPTMDWKSSLTSLWCP